MQPIVAGRGCISFSGRGSGNRVVHHRYITDPVDSSERSSDVVPRGSWFRLSPSGALALVGAVVAAVLLQRAFVAAHRTIGWAVACSVVALLLDPVIHYLDLHLPRWIAIVASMLTVAALAGLVVYVVVRQLGDSVTALREIAPESARRLEARFSLARDLQLEQRITGFVDSINTRLRREALQRVGTVPTYLVNGILTLFLLAYGRRYVNGGLAQIKDEPTRRKMARVVRRGFTRGRNYLLIAIAQAIVVTLIADGLFRALDLPADFVLALLLGVVGSIPYIGYALGGLPALLVAFGYHDTRTAVFVAVLLIVVQAVEGLVVRPRLDRRTVPVGAFFPLVIGILGYTVYGGGGAVYGFALVVIALALYDAYTYDREPVTPEASLSTEPSTAD